MPFELQFSYIFSSFRALCKQAVPDNEGCDIAGLARRGSNDNIYVAIVLGDLQIFIIRQIRKQNQHITPCLQLSNLLWQRFPPIADLSVRVIVLTFAG
ncbi:MAG: hypothetical protein ACD_75C01964G0002 [uncultured bacterium]|nr:MAG: hypothetical protein ACD_75C01964G0002 [uncultured bacterium]